MKSLKLLPQKGFTLVELLIVVSIVALLATVGITSYRFAQQKARDAQRITDLNKIQAALEQYHADNGFYPNNDFSLSDSNLNNASGRTGGDPNKVYLNQLPKDPSGGTYCYAAFAPNKTDPCDNSATICVYYSLYANLETDAPDSGNCDSDNYNFVVRPL